MRHCTGVGTPRSLRGHARRLAALLITLGTAHDVGRATGRRRAHDTRTPPLIPLGPAWTANATVATGCWDRILATPLIDHGQHTELAAVGEGIVNEVQRSVGPAGVGVGPRCRPMCVRRRTRIRNCRPSKRYNRRTRFLFTGHPSSRRSIKLCRYVMLRQSEAISCADGLRFLRSRVIAEPGTCSNGRPVTRLSHLCRCNTALVMRRDPLMYEDRCHAYECGDGAASRRREEA